MKDGQTAWKVVNQITGRKNCGWSNMVSKFGSPTVVANLIADKLAELYKSSNGIYPYRQINDSDD